ncbi:protein SEEDLING PLASTID DEVELOPMENT 1-like [Phragmites australis]|uniref:protein SEEDLING PLASTID DEVELOPMENT 1-like n=1 Tax=Phragmites australis TaxID=29695 RepID=UPI002D7824F5|nr:protein SEEDLING PLASTID DEVELOPMENT 1-like [Phragmites australis]
MPPPPPQAPAFHLHLRLSLHPPHHISSHNCPSRFPSATTSRPYAARPLSLPLRRSGLLPLCAAHGEAEAAGKGADGSKEELRRLLELLPVELRRRVETHPELPALVEVVMDLGRPPLARFPSGDFLLSHRPISFDDLRHATSQVGDFGADNRAGISRTLHRISAIRNRKGVIIGLTCRVGRAVPGSANLLQDLVEDGGSLLLIGPPGVGKTTVIREIARILADDYKKRVMIVDTSNEIGGDGDIPHPGIGNARRLQVPNQDMQHKVLIEAVENHMPQAIVIDEIGTKLDAMAASTIAQRGIQLVATAHGVTIENLIMNPSLEMLVGGIQSVTLGDEEANRRGVQKTVLERKGPSTFTCAAEIVSKTELCVHRSLEATVDALLAGKLPNVEIRKLGSKGLVQEVYVQKEQLHPALYEKTVQFDGYSLRKARTSLDSAFKLDSAEGHIERSNEADASLNIYAYGISESTALQAIKQLELEDIVTLTYNISEADAVIALQSKLKKNSQIQAAIESQDIPVFFIKINSLVQITRALRALVDDHMDELIDFEDKEEVRSSEETDALEEARLAIEQVVIPKGESVQLLPRPSSIISSQVDLIESFSLKWEVVGQEPNAHARILPHLTVKEVTAVEQEPATELTDSDTSDETDNTKNVVTRLPFLPE